MEACTGPILMDCVCELMTSDDISLTELLQEARDVDTSD
jgi:hypothetical protein